MGRWTRIAITLILSFCFSFLPSAAQAKGLLTYTFDDGGESVLTAYAILSAYNQVGVVGPHIKGTWYAPHLMISFDEMRMLQQNKWEIASHSVWHPFLTEIPYQYQDELIVGWEPVADKPKTYVASYNYAQLPFILQDGDNLRTFREGGNRLAEKLTIDEVVNYSGSFYYDKPNNQVYVQTYDGSNPVEHVMRADSAERELAWSRIEFEKEGLLVTNFIVPSSRWNAELRDLSMQYYDGVAQSYNNGYYNLIPPGDKYWMARRFVEDNTSVSTIQGWVREAEQNHYWLILCFHNVGPSWFSAEKFEEFAAWVQNEDIRVVTLQQGLEAACAGDFDVDGDVDGGDLAALIVNSSLLDLATFAGSFGKNACP